MSRIGLYIACTIGLLLSAPTHAEDPVETDASDLQEHDAAVPTGILETDDLLYDLEAFEFQDNSPLGRVIRIRELPLLTFSETPQSRFFLGVNSDGILGFHLRAR